MKKSVQASIYIFIAIIVLALFLYPKLKNNTASEPMQTGAPTRAMLPVEVAVVNPERIENTIKVTGAILANESVALRSEISGKIEKIYFREGQNVKKGDILLTINDEEIVAQVERLKYTNQLNEEIEFRQRQLLEKEAISREEYDIALTTVKTTQSDLKEREARLAKHRLRAPFDGIIGLRQVSEGSYISPSDLIANLYSINPIKVEFAVPSRYSPLVNKDDRINFSVESSEEKFTGTIYAIEPKIDQNTRTLQIRAICNNENNLLIPGLFANVTYILDVIPNALMIPSQSIIPEMNSHKIYTLKNGVVNENMVQIGLRTETRVQVTSGINPGDTIITTGILQIRQGMPVSVASIN